MKRIQNPTQVLDYIDNELYCNSNEFPKHLFYINYGPVQVLDRSTFCITSYCELNQSINSSFFSVGGNDRRLVRD